jgi:hypothetical protein
LLDLEFDAATSEETTDSSADAPEANDTSDSSEESSGSHS